MPEHFGNRQLEALQRRVADLERAAGVDPFARGVMTDRLTFTAGETRPVQHRLGRVPTGFLVTYADGPSQLYFAAEPTSTVARITSVSAGTFRLFVF
jgi:hypothetical protein